MVRDGEDYLDRFFSSAYFDTNDFKRGEKARVTGNDENRRNNSIPVQKGQWIGQTGLPPRPERPHSAKLQKLQSIPKDKVRPVSASTKRSQSDFPTPASTAPSSSSRVNLLPLERADPQPQLESKSKKVKKRKKVKKIKKRSGEKDIDNSFLVQMEAERTQDTPLHGFSTMNRSMSQGAVLPPSDLSPIRFESTVSRGQDVGRQHLVDSSPSPLFGDLWNGQSLIVSDNEHPVSWPRGPSSLDRGKQDMGRRIRTSSPVLKAKKGKEKKRPPEIHQISLNAAIAELIDLDRDKELSDDTLSRQDQNPGIMKTPEKGCDENEEEEDDDGNGDEVPETSGQRFKIHREAVSYVDQEVALCLIYIKHFRKI